MVQTSVTKSRNLNNDIQKSEKTMTKTEELLLNKEVRGLKITFYVKIAFLVFIVISSFSKEASNFEKIVASSCGILLISITLVFIFLIKKKKKLTLIGTCGSIIDVLLIGTLPIIWYISVGGHEVSPAYLLKTLMPFYAIILIITNSLAIRPLYPIIVSSGVCLVHIGLLTYALQDSRTVLTYNFINGFLGSSLLIGALAVFMLFPLMVGFLLAFITHMFRKTINEAVYLEKGISQMQRYFSPAIANKISNAEEDFLKPGGYKQEVAVLFSDIRDFTSLSEKLTPEETVELLCEYQSKMVEIIFSFGGTLDKFIGDGIMATFGTPDVQVDDAERAVKAGIAMNKALRQLNQDRQKRNQMIFQQGIGIHFGPVIVGNVGSSDRLEYTVIGDTVNAASRIESACKDLKENFLVSEAIKMKISNDIELRDLGEIKVKGKKKPIRIFAA